MSPTRDKTSADEIIRSMTLEGDSKLVDSYPRQIGGKRTVNYDLLALKAAAGYPNQSLISGTLIPPFFLASRATIVSLRAPEQKNSENSVPNKSPKNSRPWICGEYCTYAAGNSVMMLRIEHYNAKK